MKKIYILIAIAVLIVVLIFLIPRIGSGKGNALGKKTNVEEQVEGGYENVKITRNNKDSKPVNNKKEDAEDKPETDDGVDDGAVIEEENIVEPGMNEETGDEINDETDNVEPDEGVVVDNSQEELNEDTNNSVADNDNQSADDVDVVNDDDNITTDVVWEMKLVNEDTSLAELQRIKNLGVSVVSGEWGMGDGDVEDVCVFLDKVYRAGLKIEINFGDGSAWGYAEDGTDEDDQAPVWQADEVAEFIVGIKDKPAILRYNISNEAGENLPNYPDYRITLAQVRQASNTVRQADPTRQVSLRTRYWDSEDRAEIGGDANWIPLAAGLVDSVVLNLYSNYADDGVNPNTSDMVYNSGKDLVERILGIDPNVKVVIALAAYREDPYFIKPSSDELRRDIDVALQIVRDIPQAMGISFFGWGPERYPEEGKGWYMPQEGEDLIGVMGEYL